MNDPTTTDNTTPPPPPRPRIESDRERDERQRHEGVVATVKASLAAKYPDGLTPTLARGEIQARMDDPEFYKRYSTPHATGHVAARVLMRHLYSVAFPKTIESGGITHAGR